MVPSSARSAVPAMALCRPGTGKAGRSPPFHAPQGKECAYSLAAVPTVRPLVSTLATPSISRAIRVAASSCAWVSTWPRSVTTPLRPRHPGAAGDGRSLRDRTRRTVRTEPARHLQASESARARRPHLHGRRRAAAPTQTGAGATGRGHGLDRALPRDLRTELPTPRRAARRTPGHPARAQTNERIAPDPRRPAAPKAVRAHAPTRRGEDHGKARRSHIAQRSRSPRHANLQRTAPARVGGAHQARPRAQVAGL